MDTWSVANITLDVLFAVTFVGVILGVLYFRERRLRAQLQELQNRLRTPLPTMLQRFSESPQPNIPTSPEPVSLPARVETSPEPPGKPKPARRPSSTRVTRAERYLEAVRMYREGRDKGTIEKTLGISFMELELLGRIK